MAFKVVGDRVAVEPTTQETVSPGGIYLPEKASLLPDTSGRVTSVGDGVQRLEVGDQVFFSPQAGFELTIEGKRVLVLKEDQILGVME